MKMPMRATPKMKMMKKARIRKTMTRSNSMGRLACSSPFLVSRCQIWRGSSIGFRGNLHGAGTVTWSSDLVDRIMTGVLVDKSQVDISWLSSAYAIIRIGDPTRRRVIPIPATLDLRAFMNFLDTFKFLNTWQTHEYF
jgi:hypothetical protein